MKLPKHSNPKHLCICIPAFKETEICKTLDSLSICEHKGLFIKIKVFINGSANDNAETQFINENSFKEVQDWILKYVGSLKIECNIDLNLEEKNAGVGLARKILGDKSANEFKEKGLNGILVYLDADSTVETNYFQEISRFFLESQYSAASISFQHQITNPDRDIGIIEYESHLRYFRLMQSYLALPFAFHTVGSSMAVLSNSYLAKGGMNKRKAGEDFYFLHKFIKDNECGNLTSTRVYPSARDSDRVPFGTGRAMLNFQDKTFHWHTYNPQSFELLKPFLSQIDNIYEGRWDSKELDERLEKYLIAILAKENFAEMRKNVSSLAAFRKRFFQFFDAFKLMKYLHFIRDEGLVDVAIDEATAWYFNSILKDEYPENSHLTLLKLREVDV